MPSDMYSLNSQRGIPLFMQVLLLPRLALLLLFNCGRQDTEELAGFLRPFVRIPEGSDRGPGGDKEASGAQQRAVAIKQTNDGRDAVPPTDESVGGTCSGSTKVFQLASHRGKIGRVAYSQNSPGQASLELFVG